MDHQPWASNEHSADLSSLRDIYLQDLRRVGFQQANSHAPTVGEHSAPAHGASVGWGGLSIPSESSVGGPRWFGRNRSKAQPRTQRASHPRGAEQLFSSEPAPLQPTASTNMHRSTEDVLSVEEILHLVKRLGRAEALPDRVFRALHHLDSRAVALLLKDLSKSNLDSRSIELFDALRALPERHLLKPLCDVYTYTATISLCIYQQNVDRAMELLAEMRAKGIERNVHTYTALMNVCIKCGKLTTALDIFQGMKAEGCTPNVVTYNTLIDVYGKLGKWDRAVNVLKLMRAEGVMPALRTFNTLIIACNMCNQPREALAVYQELQDSGLEANSTTYNALISAYGKLGQLDRVLEVYQDMVWKGLERSVITYSSLISACEKAGRWETALELFNEMQRDGCSPNTVTYNSLITACGQGAQWERARQVFDQMQVDGCTPDVVTYTALISALERGGQWQMALDAYNQMVQRNCKPDAIVYNAIIDALWQTGVVWAQAKAGELFAMAMKQGYFRNERMSADGRRAELNLHALTAGVAMLSLHNWLQDIQRKVLAQGDSGLPPLLAVVTDAGNASKEQGNFVIKEAVSTMMSFWGAPFRAVQDRTYLSVLEANGHQLAAWVRTDAFSAQMASLFPCSAAEQPGLEQLTQQQCSDAFGAVQQFEASHNLVLQNMPMLYLQQRTGLVSKMIEKGSALGLKDEVVHDAVLLLDRTASTGAQVSPDMLPLLSAAALHLSTTQGASDTPALPAATLAEVCSVEPSALLDMCWRLQQLLSNDTMAISTMRCLKVYLERVGYRYLDKQGIYVMAGLPIMLAVEAMFDMSLLNCRPSVVAAALLYAERRQRGAVPFWPSVLAKLTGYEDLTAPELACAVRTSQKLCRKMLYTQIYKQQCVGLAAQAVQAAVQHQQQQCGLIAIPSSTAMVRALSTSSNGSSGTTYISALTPAYGDLALPSMQSAGSVQQLGQSSFVPLAAPAAMSSQAACSVVGGSALAQQMSSAVSSPFINSMSLAMAAQQQQQGQGPVTTVQLVSTLPMANSLQSELSCVMNGGTGQVTVPGTVYAVPAGYPASSTTAAAAEGLNVMHMGAAPGVQQEYGLGNLAYSLSVLGLSQDAA